MKTCLLTIGTLGDVVPDIALGQRLKENGHEVTVATLGEFEPVKPKVWITACQSTWKIAKIAQEAQNNSPGPQRKSPLHLIRQYSEMANDTLQDEWESARDA